MSERERFEAIVSSSPYEKSIRRWPDDATTHAWPGSYRDLDVDFAWLVLQDFLARSGQAASGSSQGARSDVPNGVGVGQPEAPTAAPLEPVAHMFPSDLEKFKTNETWAQAFSVAVGSPDERTVPLYAHPPARSGADPTGRTPTDYALEFAEYLAKAAEGFLAAIDTHAALLLRRAESDDVDEDDVGDASVTVDEYRRSVYSGIYEFRKRRDRAIARSGAGSEEGRG